MFICSKLIPTTADEKEKWASVILEKGKSVQRIQLVGGPATEEIPCPVKWEDVDDCVIGQMFQFVATHKYLCKIELLLWKNGCSNLDLQMAGKTCQAFLINPFVPATEKRIHVELNLEKDLLQDCFAFLHTASTAITDLKVYWWGLEQQDEELLASRIFSLSMLRSLSICPATVSSSIVLDSLTNDETACHIVDLSIQSRQPPLASVGGFLLSKSATWLESIELSLQEDFTVEDTEKLTCGLLRSKSLQKMRLTFRYDSMGVGASQVLSKYLSEETKLEILYLNLYAHEEITTVDEELSAQILLDGVLSNTSITDLHLVDFSCQDISGKVMLNFFQQLSVDQLTIQHYNLTDQNVLSIVQGLHQNQRLRSLHLQSHDDLTFEANLKPLTKLLTVSTQGNNNELFPPPMLMLETLTLGCIELEHDDDTGHYCDLLRRPIPTLKSIHLSFAVANGPMVLTSLLDALKESSGGQLESFGLKLIEISERGHVALPGCLSSLETLLPHLSNISSLELHVDDDPPPVDLKQAKDRLYQSFLSNTGITSLTLGQLVEDDPQFKCNIQSVCIRNKVYKAIAALQDYSLPLMELPTLLQEVQQDCEEVGMNPEELKTELINAGLRLSAEPETMQAIEDQMIDESK